MRHSLWHERFGPSISYACCLEGSVFGDIPVCQFLEDGQTSRHRTARDSIVDKNGVKLQEARLMARGSGVGSIEMLSAHTASGWQQAEGTSVSYTTLKPRMSIQARDCQELTRHNGQSIHSRISLSHCLKELSHNIRAQPSSLRFRSVWI